MNAFVELFHRMALLVFTPKCYEVLFVDLDFFNGKRARFSRSSEQRSCISSKAQCFPDEHQNEHLFVTNFSV
jgi:hypothetical protein